MNNLPEILSIVYAVFIILGYMPALKGLIKDKDVSGVSFCFWTFIIFAVYVSFLSLLLTGAATFQFLSVGINLLLGGFCFAIYVVRSKQYEAFVTTIPGVVILTFIITTNQPIAQTLGTVSIIAAYVAQIYSFYRNKNTKGTSKYLYLIIGAGLACLIYSLIITGENIYVIITEIANLILILVCFVQCLYYERKIKNGNIS